MLFAEKPWHRINCLSSSVVSPQEHPVEVTNLIRNATVGCPFFEMLDDDEGLSSRTRTYPCGDVYPHQMLGGGIFNRGGEVHFGASTTFEENGGLLKKPLFDTFYYNNTRGGAILNDFGGNIT